jgi:uncharacterized repeat protein (TIGR03803 family)
MKIHSVSQRGQTQRLAVYMALPLLICLAIPTGIHAQTLTTLQNFDGTNGAFPDSSLIKGPQGAQGPHHRVVQHSNGNYYGVTPIGGANNAGTVYQLTPAGVETTIYSFCSVGASCADGSFPEGALVAGSDGNLYGTTYSGGTNGDGTVFKITTTGALTTLYNFGSKASAADGANPLGALVQGSDGNFYGTTYLGGNSTSSGTVFKITSGGSLTTIYSFSGPDGANPEGDLVQSIVNGEFYGATAAGGNSNSAGTAFDITSSGSLTTIYDFCSKTNCNDGSDPQVPFSADAFGNFYGTTAASGANAYGTLFQISPFFGLHTLYHFCSKTNCTDGATPEAGPLVGQDGNIYGTTFQGGANDAGTVFQFTPWGVLNTLYNFCTLANCADGQYPEASLVQGSNGNFYGTTSFGGTYGDGTVYNLATIPSTGSSCNGVYSGTYFGNIIVTSGQSCEFTDGGQIFGNIYLQGGSLTLTNASVFGNVQIQSGTYALGPSLSIWSTLAVQNVPAGTTTNTICGVSVNGSLYFDNNGSPAEIGSTTGACPGNTIGGDLEVINNSALVQVFDNTARDFLICSGNSSITGGGNSARSKQGQCSSF